MSSVNLFLFVVVWLAVTVCDANEKPLIGILTLPCSDEPHWCLDSDLKGATTYLPASYVKWLESGGARIIPIVADSSHSSVQALLPKLNGVLITGGGASFSSGTFWWDQLQNVMDSLRSFAEKSQQKKAIPLWSTCLGFEAVLCSIAGSTAVKISRIAEDMALPIDFVSGTETDSRMFNSFMDADYASSVYNKLGTENLTMNFHNYGVSPDSFTSGKYPHLSGNLSVLGTSIDEHGYTFVTLFESLNNAQSGNLYWYGSQFHPEKPQFIFDYKSGVNMVHSLDAIFVSQYFTEFFVNECRLRNTNTMAQSEYDSSVIYNYQPFFMYNGTSSYEQVYLFKKPN